MKPSTSNLRSTAGVLEHTYLASIPALQGICELPGVGRTNTKYQGGFTIVHVARTRGRNWADWETGTPDLSNKVCTTNEPSVSVLMTFAGLGGVVIPSGRVVDSRPLEVYTCLNAGESHVA